MTTNDQFQSSFVYIRLLLIADSFRQLLATLMLQRLRYLMAQSITGACTYKLKLYWWRQLCYLVRFPTNPDCRIPPSRHRCESPLRSPESNEFLVCKIFSAILYSIPCFAPQCLIFRAAMSRYPVDFIPPLQEFVFPSLKANISWLLCARSSN